VPTALPLHVTELGEGSETFLFLHGYGGSSFTWRFWTSELAARGRLLLVDLKGFGHAPKPADDEYAPSDHARLIVRLMRELDLRNVTLVGHSLGGGIALLTVLELLDSGEERLARLVLVAAPAYRQRLPPLVPLSRRPRLGAALLRLLGPRRVVRWVLRSIVHDRQGVTEDQVLSYARPLESPEGVHAAMSTGRRILPERIDEIAKRYPEIRLPTLLLWGLGERVVPLWVAQRLASDLPNARLSLLEKCGHIPPEERPAESLSVLLEFLDQTG
jgi:pimeloyl-ACP methyl ester carboxylesterase